MVTTLPKPLEDILTKSSIKIIESLKLLHKAYYLKSKSIRQGPMLVIKRSQNHLDEFLIVRKKTTHISLDRSEMESGLEPKGKSRLVDIEL